MAHMGYCGKMNCSDCKGCELEESMPCYPDCEGFLEDHMRVNSCIECDAFLSYVNMFNSSNNITSEDILEKVKYILSRKSHYGFFNTDDIEEVVKDVLEKMEV